MCIMCEKGKSLAILYQILDRLENDGQKSTDIYQYVQTKVNELKVEIDAAEEILKDIMIEWQQENSLFYPIIKDEKQALKN